MDLSQLLLNSLLGDSSVNTLSKSSGASQNQVQQVVGLALPVLMKSMENNASTKEGEESLAKALEEHGKKDTKDISAFLQNADLKDGNKIIAHILGNNKKSVESDIAKKSGLTSAQTSNILANAAPLLLTILGGQTKSKTETGGLAVLLASVLLGGGGSSGTKSTSKSGGGLEDLLLGSLGSLLGGIPEPEKKTTTKKAASKKTTASKTSTKKAPAKKATTSKTPAKKTTTKKAAPKKAEPDNVLDTLIGSLFGIDGKEKK